MQDFVQAGLGGSDDESAQSWLKRLMKTSTREQGKHEISLLGKYVSLIIIDMLWLLLLNTPACKLRCSATVATLSCSFLQYTSAGYQDEQ